MRLAGGSQPGGLLGGVLVQMDVRDAVATAPSLPVPHAGTMAAQTAGFVSGGDGTRAGRGGVLQLPGVGQGPPLRLLNVTAHAAPDLGKVTSPERFCHRRAYVSHLR